MEDVPSAVGEVATTATTLLLLGAAQLVVAVTSTILFDGTADTPLHAAHARCKEEGDVTLPSLLLRFAFRMQLAGRVFATVVSFLSTSFSTTLPLSAGRVQTGSVPEAFFRRCSAKYAGMLRGAGERDTIFFGCGAALPSPGFIVDGTPFIPAAEALRGWWMGCRSRRDGSSVFLMHLVVALASCGAARCVGFN